MVADRWRMVTAVTHANTQSSTPQQPTTQITHNKAISKQQELLYPPPQSFVGCCGAKWAKHPCTTVKPPPPDSTIHITTTIKDYYTIFRMQSHSISHINILKSHL
jgi:hypothetical protein